jgi:hypothetical protein
MYLLEVETCIVIDDMNVLHNITTYSDFYQNIHMIDSTRIRYRSFFVLKTTELSVHVQRNGLRLLDFSVVYPKYSWYFSLFYKNREVFPKSCSVLCELDCQRRVKTSFPGISEDFSRELFELDAARDGLKEKIASSESLPGGDYFDTSKPLKPEVQSGSGTGGASVTAANVGGAGRALSARGYVVELFKEHHTDLSFYQAAFAEIHGEEGEKGKEKRDSEPGSSDKIGKTEKTLADNIKVDPETVATQQKKTETVAAQQELQAQLRERKAETAQRIGQPKPSDSRDHWKATPGDEKSRKTEEENAGNYWNECKRRCSVTCKQRLNLFEKVLANSASEYSSSSENKVPPAQAAISHVTPHGVPHTHAGSALQQDSPDPQLQIHRDTDVTPNVVCEVGKHKFLWGIPEERPGGAGSLSTSPGSNNSDNPEKRAEL